MNDDEAVSLLRDLIRLETVSGTGPDGSYAECVSFLERECLKICPFITTHVETVVTGKPVLRATIPGTDPSLPSLVLNSHYDVVPVMREHWTSDPFAADVVDNRIIGRGTQDMKCVCAQYVASLRRLFDGATAPVFARTIHLTFVPDEEIGGKDGMRAYLDSEDFKTNVKPVALALDEGLANPAPNTFTVFYGERVPYWLLFHAKGPTGHGSRFIHDTAIEQLTGLLKTVYEFRAEQRESLGTGGCAHCSAKKLGDVTTMNVTMLDAGVPMSASVDDVDLDGNRKVALNVLPTDARMGMALRIPPSVPLQSMHDRLDSWCKQAGDVTWKHADWTTVPSMTHAVTSIDPVENPFWAEFHSVVKDELNYSVEAEVFPAGTDSRFLREEGIRALGFSPMAGCEIMLHEHNEYIPIDVYLAGIPVYEKLLPRLASLLCDVDKTIKKKRKV